MVEPVLRILVPRKCERPLTLLSFGVVLSANKTYPKHDLLLLLVPIPGDKTCVYHAVSSLVINSPWPSKLVTGVAGVVQKL